MSSAGGAAAGAGASRPGKEREDGGDERRRKEEEGGVAEGDVEMDLYGAASGWVEARTSCPHLPAMPAASADDLARLPPPDSQCSRFGSFFLIESGVAILRLPWELLGSRSDWSIVWLNPSIPQIDIDV